MSTCVRVSYFCIQGIPASYFDDVQGDSEETIGKWLKRTGHKDVFVATKFGFVPTDWSVRGDPEWVRSQFEESYEKLGVETIDLYYLHRPDPKTPIEITVGAMAELVKWVVFVVSVGAF